MHTTEDARDPVIARIVDWASTREDVRAVVLTSTRAVSDAPTDPLSDHDLVLYLSDPAALAGDSSWLSAFGTVLVRFRSELQEGGYPYAMRLVVFEDGTKIDFALAPVALLDRMVGQQRLVDTLDVGYRVLVDKDDRTARLPPPTYLAHIPPRPDQSQFHDLVEEFWWESLYVAKDLWREELLPAKHSLETVMKLNLLRRMLEWRVETDHAWALRPGDLGRGLKQRVDAGTWSELSETFVGAGTAENWDALLRTTALFRRVAGEVALRLGLSYPSDLDARVTARLEAIRRLPKT